MDGIITPEWAKRHGYYWHSNPRSKTRSKTLFDKCVVRPKVQQCWDIIRSDWATVDDVEEAWNVVRRLDGKFNQSASANMECGRLAQTAADMVVFEHAELAEAQAWVVQEFECYDPRDWDSGVDKEKQDQYLTELPDVIANAVEGLREAMHGLDDACGERDLIGYIGENRVPYKTLPDYCYCGDLKTKWSRRSKTTKSGWSANSLPKTLTGMWEQANVSQIAGFRALNGGRPAWLLYVNKSDYRLFTQDNCDELKPEYLNEVIRETERQNKVTEKMLEISDTTADLLELVSPEWDELCWKEPPGYLEEAYRIWKQ